MKTKYTPGPWYAQKSLKTRPIGILSESGLHICDVESYGALDKATQANAQLISAAPELLQGLQEAVKWLRDLGYGQTPHCQEFKDIIDKAT